MCGLAGLIRHPKAGVAPERLHTILDQLLLGAASRGRHATGIATFKMKEKPKIFKKAVPAKVFVESDAYREFTGENVSGELTGVIGHTRFSTFSHNSGMDEAAHPFQAGETIGAHNGMIRNWQDLAKKYLTDHPPFEVDSHVAIAMLERFDAKDALNKMMGWYALTWWQKNRFYMIRNDAPLHLAYVPSWKALFWGSEKRVVLEVLRDNGAAIGSSWDLITGRLYEFNPKVFSKDGAHPTTTQMLSVNAKHTWGGWGGTSTTVAVTRKRDYSEGFCQPESEGVEQEELFSRVRFPEEQEVEQKKQSERIARLEDQIETMQIELDWLYQVMEEKGLLDLEIVDVKPPEDLGEIVQE